MVAALSKENNLASYKSTQTIYAEAAPMSISSERIRSRGYKTYWEWRDILNIIIQLVFLQNPLISISICEKIIIYTMMTL